MSKLSKEALAARMPRPPDELVGALQDGIRVVPTRVRAARSIKIDKFGVRCDPTRITGDHMHPERQALVSDNDNGTPLHALEVPCPTCGSPRFYPCDYVAPPLDKNTLNHLLVQAMGEVEVYRARYDRWDDREDLDALEAARIYVSWLGGLISAIDVP